MVNRAKAKGTAFETLIVPVIRSMWPWARRGALKGARDEGDIDTGPLPFVIEAKNYAGSPRLAQWWNEAEAEKVSAGKPAAVVVFKRKGKGRAEDQWVLTTLGDLVEIVTAIRAEYERSTPSDVA